MRKDDTFIIIQSVQLRLHFSDVTFWACSHVSDDAI